MLMDSRETEWYASMLQILGREKGLRLMRGLAKQDLSFRPGRTLITPLYVSDISLAKDYARYDKEFKDIFGLK